MDFAIHKCEIPKRSEYLDEYVDLLYPEYEFHPQVYNRVIKYTFLVLLDKLNFPKPSGHVIDLCKRESEKIRSNKPDYLKVIDDETTETIVQAVIDNDNEKEIIEMISMEENWEMRKFFEEELIPYLTMNAEVIQIVNDNVIIDDKLYVISTTNDINTQIDKIIKEPNIKNYYILNIINNEMIELKFTVDDLNVAINEEKKTIEIKKFGNISDFKLTTFSLETKLIDNSAFLSRVIYKLLKYDRNITFNKYSNDIYCCYFKTIDFSAVIKVIEYAKESNKIYDIDYITAEAKIRNNDGRRFIELAILKNIERRRKHKPIFHWKLTTDDLYDYCLESRRDQFCDYDEDPLEFYIDNYSGFDLSNVDDAAFDLYCKYALNDLKSCNGYIRRAALRTSKEIIGLTRMLRYSSDESHDIKFEQEFLRSMMFENQLKIKEASKMLNEALEISDMIAAAMK